MNQQFSSHEWQIKVYIACTDDAELGWDENGFSSFIGIENVPNLALINTPKPVPGPSGSANPATNLSPQVQTFIANPNPVPSSRSSFSSPQQAPVVTFAALPPPSRTSFPASGSAPQVMGPFAPLTLPNIPPMSQPLIPGSNLPIPNPTVSQQPPQQAQQAPQPTPRTSQQASQPTSQPAPWASTP